MLNTTNFLALITPSETTKIYFEKMLTSELTSFSDISNFPNYKGLYFLYYESTLLYIGSASAESRTVKKRCQQYIQQGNGGNSFRGKIELLQNIPPGQAIKFIKMNIQAKFIDLSEIQENKIKQLEQVAIYACQPPLNFVLNKFDYKNLDVEQKNWQNIREEYSTNPYFWSGFY